MESTIKIGGFDVRVNNRAGWTITYRDQFGHDIIPTLMPLFAGAFDVISELVKETGKTGNVGIDDVLAITDGDALINAMVFDIIFGIFANGGNQVLLQMDLIQTSDKLGLLNKKLLHREIR